MNCKIVLFENAGADFILMCSCWNKAHKLAPDLILIDFHSWKVLRSQCIVQKEVEAEKRHDKVLHLITVYYETYNLMYVSICHIRKYLQSIIII